MAKSPFSVGDEAIDEDLVQLGDAAAAAIGDAVDGAAIQDPLEGTDYLKVKFVGMSMDSLEDTIQLGSNLTFVVQARCIGEGTDLSKVDGHEKRFVKMDVQSVKIQEEK